LTDEWVQDEGERLRGRYLDALISLMRRNGRHGALDDALACGRRALQLDPLREEVHREMVQLFADSGQSVQAVRQFETCRRARRRAGRDPGRGDDLALPAHRWCRQRSAGAPGGRATQDGTLRRLYAALSGLEPSAPSWSS
jgi:DNA-binding SARP family transcriptional activator